MTYCKNLVILVSAFMKTDSRPYFEETQQRNIKRR